jgi:hypothetical protein
MQHRHLAAGLCLAGVSLLSAGLAGCGGAAATATGTLGAAGSAAAPGGPGNSGPPDASLAGIRACQLISGSAVSSVIGKLSEPAYQTPDGLACFYEPFTASVTTRSRPTAPPARTSTCTPQLAAEP